MLREPLLHFMFIGAVIYSLYGLFAEPVVEENEPDVQDMDVFSLGAMVKF